MSDLPKITLADVSISNMDDIHRTRALMTARIAARGGEVTVGWRLPRQGPDEAPPNGETLIWLVIVSLGGYEYVIGESLPTPMNGGEPDVIGMIEAFADVLNQMGDSISIEVEDQ